MSKSQQTPKIPLPKGWKKQVRSAVLHVLSLAQYAVRRNGDGHIVMTQIARCAPHRPGSLIIGHDQ